MKNYIDYECPDIRIVSENDEISIYTQKEVVIEQDLDNRVVMIKYVSENDKIVEMFENESKVDVYLNRVVYTDENNEEIKTTLIEDLYIRKILKDTYSDGVGDNIIILADRKVMDRYILSFIERQNIKNLSKSIDNTHGLRNIRNSINKLTSVVSQLIPNKEEPNMKLRIKYLDGAKKMEKISKGNWIDVYAYEDTFVPVGERAMINLGFALELPKGWEGHLAPRSSTFKTWGVIQTNHVGVVDDTYIGDSDIWHMPVYCLQGKELKFNENDVTQKEGMVWAKTKEQDNGVLVYGNIRVNGQLDEISQFIPKGTWIRKGDKIGQFRLMEVMPEIEFEEVEHFGNQDRGGFGTTGVK